jgi:hypothetical protein
VISLISRNRRGRRIAVVVIEIVVDGVEPLSGRVSADGRPPVAFTGWLALLGMLERLTTSGPLAPQGPGDELDA